MALIEKVLASKFSRRDFLKGSAAVIGAAGAALTASGKVAAANELQTTKAGTSAGAFEPQTTLEGGKWISAICPHNCGGKCLVRAYVKDGVILRQKTDDFNTDDRINRQQRACLRGLRSP